MSDLRYGLNIGTQNISISSIDSREILTEKNVIAVRDGKYVIGYGDEAYEMYEKAPENVEVTFPVSMGVISSLALMQAVLEGLYKKLNRGKLIKGSEFLIAVPTDVTEVEKRSFYELVAGSKIRPKKVSVVEKSIADSIACGIDPKVSTGNMMINIGADTTDISVISYGGIVIYKTIKIAGNRFNELIANSVRSAYGMLIGDKTAELLKKELADFSGAPEERELTVFARRIATGLPAKVTVQSELVTNALEDPLRIIAEDAKRVLEKTPPELTADITENGVYLLGGGACLKNIDSFFAKELDLKVNSVKDPAGSTIRGVTKIFASSRYDKLRYFPQEKEYN